MEEHQAITRLKQGDVSSLEGLVESYYLLAVRAAYLVVQDAALAEDVAQTSFVNLPQKIQQFDDSKNFRPWFLRSVVNAAISACRQRSHTLSLNEDDESALLEKLSEADPGPEESCITQETRQAVWRALEQLSPQQRAAIVLRYYLELSENEMAGQLNRPKSTIKWLLFSARKKLRQLLQPEQKYDMNPDKVLQREEHL